MQFSPIINTYCDCQWFRIFYCIDGKPCQAIGGSDAFHPVCIHHHYNALCRTAVRFQNFNLLAITQTAERSKHIQLSNEKMFKDNLIL